MKGIVQAKMRTTKPVFTAADIERTFLSAAPLRAPVRSAIIWVHLHLEISYQPGSHSDFWSQLEIQFSEEQYRGPSPQTLFLPQHPILQGSVGELGVISLRDLTSSKATCFTYQV